MIYVLDVETTGLDPQVDRIVELAIASVDPTTSAVAPVYEGFVNPGIPIPPEASAVHHITNGMVKDCPMFEEVVLAVLNQLGGRAAGWPLEQLELTGEVGDVYVAHNAPFDRDFLGGLFPANSWIDTCRVAKHLYPDAPGYSNQVLRYWLGIEIDTKVAHRAMEDVRVTAEIFLRELGHDDLGADEIPIGRLLKLSQTPVLLKTVTFGKHKGELWRDVDAGYLRWASLQTWDDADIGWTVKQAILGTYR